MTTIWNRSARIAALWLCAMPPTACAQTAPPPAPAKPAAPVETTFIREFLHPRVVAHYHPRAGMPFRLEHARYALENGAHGLELDLHMRGSDVVCNHDGPAPDSPTLREVLNVIVQYQGQKATVHGDGRQFFLVLEPKENDPGVFEKVFDLLTPHLGHLSTAARPGDAPRGLTVVVTGAHLGALRTYFSHRLAELNRRVILENHDYRAEIRNLSDDGAPFQWTAIQHPRQYGRVNALHAGTDGQLNGKFNIRIWGEGPALAEAYASGADSINCDHEQLVPFQEMVRSMALTGARPSVAIRGTQALAAWTSPAGELYAALGAAAEPGVTLPRPLSLTAFLKETPKGSDPAAALLPDGRVLIVYADAKSGALTSVCGRFLQTDRFITFAGGVRGLISADGGPVLGVEPSVAVLPDGGVEIVYRAQEGPVLRRFRARMGAVNVLPGATGALEAEMDPL